MSVDCTNECLSLHHGPQKNKMTKFFIKWADELLKTLKKDSEGRHTNILAARFRQQEKTQILLGIPM